MLKASVLAYHPQIKRTKINENTHELTTKAPLSRRCDVKKLGCKTALKNLIYRAKCTSLLNTPESPVGESESFKL